MAVNPRHGEVWLVDMGLAAKVRPVTVLLADDLDVERTLILHVPITTQSRGGPLEVGVGHLGFLDRASVANVQAMGSLPRVRFKRDSAFCRPMIWIESNRLSVSLFGCDGETAAVPRHVCPPAGCRSARVQPGRHAGNAVGELLASMTLRLPAACQLWQSETGTHKLRGMVVAVRRLGKTAWRERKAESGIPASQSAFGFRLSAFRFSPSP